MEGAQTSFALEPELITATFLTPGSRISHNEAWETVFGKEEDDPWTRLPDQDRALVNGYLADATEGSAVTNRLFMVKHPMRDQPLPVLLHFLPIVLPDKGEPRVAAILVTGEVLAEPTSWMLSQTERQRMETLGRMTMGIIHDFNNLLSGILGHTELLKRFAGQDKLAFEQADDHLDTIETAAIDGAALVRKIQQYIRQERERAFEPVDLRRIVEDAVALTKPYWYNEPRRQGIQIEANMESGDIPPVMGSPSELRDVLVNLILNAVQALPQGGHIVLRTSHRAGMPVSVEVEDDGTGMTDRVRARIFEPLFTTKGKRGTGMGLAVCYGTVQEHEGDIQVETSLGFGTKITVLLPAADADALQPETTVEEPNRKSARILVVDDEKMVRSVLARLLTVKGHTVAEAGSGAEALERAATDAFDVVFTDQGMPEMSGRELAARLRRSFPELPIILLTGDTEAGSPDADVSLVMSKPFRVESLDDAIQDLIRA